MSQFDDVIECEVCSKRVYSWGMHDHIKAKHGKTIQCQCGKKFLTSGDMWRHKRMSDCGGKNIHGLQ